MVLFKLIKIALIIIGIITVIGFVENNVDYIKSLEITKNTLHFEPEVIEPELIEKESEENNHNSS